MVKQNKGFTLIELLIIIGIIGFLAAAILVAVDPVRRIQEARDSRRWSEVNSILNAYLNRQVDDKEYYFGYFDDGAVPPNPWEMGDVKTYYAGVVPSDLNTAQIIVDGSSVDFVDIDCDALDETTPVCGYAGVAAVHTASVLPNVTGDPLDLTKACVADLRDLAPEYISQLPTDPHGDAWDMTGGAADAPPLGAANTGYYIHMNTSHRVTIGACWPERVTSISVQR